MSALSHTAIEKCLQSIVSDDVAPFECLVGMTKSGRSMIDPDLGTLGKNQISNHFFENWSSRDLAS